MIRYVYMRAPGEAPGLTQQVHGVRNWIFRAKIWEKKNLNDEQAEFLRNYRNPSGVRLFDVADTHPDALRVVAERKRARMAAQARSAPALALSDAEGIAGSDDDLVRFSIAESAVAKATAAPPPRAATSEEVLLAEAEAAVSAVVEAEAEAVEEAPAEPELSYDEAVALVSTFAGHERTEAAVEMFGESLPNVIVDAPAKLLGVNGIGSKTVAKIVRAARNVGGK